MELSEHLNLIIAIAQSRIDAVALDRIRELARLADDLEAENAELREKYQTAENSRRIEHAASESNFLCREKLEKENDELREKLVDYEVELAAAHTIADHNHDKVVKLKETLAETIRTFQRENKDLEVARKRYQIAEAELARLKSPHAEGQWAVTCRGLGPDEADSNARILMEKFDSQYYAVRLHAQAEDGPWVLMCRDHNGVFYRPYGPGDGKLSAAHRYATREDANKDCGFRYIPVRLADVPAT